MVIAPQMFNTTSWNEIFQQSATVGDLGGRTYFRPAHNDNFDDADFSYWPSSMTHAIVQFWYRSSDVTSIEILRWQEIAGGTSHCRLQLTAGAELEVTLGNSTSLATSTETLSTDTWYYIQWECVIHDTLGSHIVKLDGTEVINISGIDTRNGGVSGALDRLLFAASGLASYSDMILADDSGSDFNALSDDILALDVLYPNGAGNSADWTASTGNNYETVNEEPLSETDYNESSTDGHKDTFALENSDSVSEVICLVPTAIGENTDATARQLNGVARHSSSEAAGSDISLIQNRLLMIQSFAYDNPSTASAWSASEVDAAEAGYELSV